MELTTFHVCGINYKKSNVLVRGKYSISDNKYKKLLTGNLSNFFILSTCNRTEVYGYGPSIDDLIELICSETEGTKEDFINQCYIKSGQDALRHLSQVACGLDSQILGDYEIIGQLKSAINKSKASKKLGGKLEKLTNKAIYISRQVKNNTNLSKGIVSVSSVAIEYIRKHIPDVSTKNILIVGMGKMGRSTCKNLIDYLHCTKITLMNRTEEVSDLLSKELQVGKAHYNTLKSNIFVSDIIIVATNAEAPIISKSDIDNNPKLILDLSVPANVNYDVTQLPTVTLVDLDTLSKVAEDNLQLRVGDVSKAQELIEFHIAKFS